MTTTQVLMRLSSSARSLCSERAIGRVSLRRGRPIRSFTAGTLLCASFLTSPAYAQTQVALDAGYSPELVWRGLTRIEQYNFQASLSLAYSSPSWMLTTGAWATLEPSHSNQGPTLAGRDKLIGEVDYWLQLDHRIAGRLPIDLAAGLALFRFYGDPSAGGLDEGANTEELYVRARFPSLGRWLFGGLPLALEVPVHGDIGRYNGVYLEPALEADLPVLFIGEPLGSLILRTGFGVSQGLADDTDGDPGYYRRDGLTHFEATAGITPFMQIGKIGMTIYAATHLQVGLDPVTIERPSGKSDRVRMRWEIVASVLSPLRRTR